MSKKFNNIKECFNSLQSGLADELKYVKQFKSATGFSKLIKAGEIAFLSKNLFDDQKFCMEKFGNDYSSTLEFINLANANSQFIITASELGTEVVSLVNSIDSQLGLDSTVFQSIIDFIDNSIGHLGQVESSHAANHAEPGYLKIV